MPTGSDRSAHASLVSDGPGPFVTLRIHRQPGGRHRVATSRRHRKGLSHHEVERLEDARVAPATPLHAFAHVWAPTRLGWWIAVCFGVGALHFFAAAVSGAWPACAPEGLADTSTQSHVYFAGSLFFTTAAWLQWLEALNRDVAHAHEPRPRAWRWFGWCPRNLGYLACTVQLAGTLLFNLNTAEATRAALAWAEQDWLVWTPDMLGSLCFLTASYLAFAEVSHGSLSFAPKSVSWWIAVVNGLGSVAFQISALLAWVGPSPTPAWRAFWATAMTAAGAACFAIGAYLLVPELYDEAETVPDHTPEPTLAGSP